MEWLLAALLVLAGVFGLIGSFGLLKLTDPMQRLHAPTKASTVGLGAVLVVSMLQGWGQASGFSWHELLVTIFLLLTAPITANFLAKVQIHSRMRPGDLPPTGVGTAWATFRPDLTPDQAPDPAPRGGRPDVGCPDGGRLDGA